MGLSCGAKFLKYCLFAFNLIFFVSTLKYIIPFLKKQQIPGNISQNVSDLFVQIAGIVCLGIGIWLVTDNNAYGKLSEAVESMKLEDETRAKEFNDIPSASVSTVGVILSIGGAIVIVIAFLGCCGAVKEWRPLLVFYAIFLMIILAVELSAAVYAIISRGSLESNVSKFMQKTLKYYDVKDGKDTKIKETWDTIMSTSKCCGVNGTADDFKATSGWRSTAGSVLNVVTTVYPPACCPAKADGELLMIGECLEANKYEQGCFTKLRDTLTNQLSVTIGVAVAVAIIQLVGIVFAFCLCKAIGEEADM